MDKPIRIIETALHVDPNSPKSIGAGIIGLCIALFNGYKIHPDKAVAGCHLALAHLLAACWCKISDGQVKFTPEEMVKLEREFIDLAMSELEERLPISIKFIREEMEKNCKKTENPPQANPPQKNDGANQGGFGVKISKDYLWN